jgi:hypothetical protein
MTRKEFDNLRWLGTGQESITGKYITEEFLAEGYPFTKMVAKSIGRDPGVTFVGYGFTLLNYQGRYYQASEVDKFLTRYNEVPKERAELWWNRKYGKKE